MKPKELERIMKNNPRVVSHEMVKEYKMLKKVRGRIREENIQAMYETLEIYKHQFRLCMTLTLRDAYGFGGQRIQRGFEKFDEIYDSVMDKFLSLEDIHETIVSETGFNYREYMESRG